ncbi:MAG: HAMP domain-containing sensor histidine kinase [Paracoccus sp. (in: a-proteobacteria)]|uniref:sensor histidine kinase n=1 Tax=Paracoccus sp. TaxID=267 RepID=UPI0026E0DB30|nr:HAMP domain-containing sensor histidine kinase [Paracoccus sp. (in: a-proteobacteria)]MDO5630371.1 HAMP domain-containing sensor histidine kinase [Paracoccus sp. (in: a-proteobacteria)]
MIRSLRARLLLLAAVWITVALLAAFLVIGAVLDRFVAERYDSEMQAMADQVMAGMVINNAGGIEVENTPLDPRFGTPLSGWYWQLRAGGVVVAKSASLADAQLVSRDPDKTGTGRGRGPMGEPLRVLNQPLTLPDSDDSLMLTVTAPAREMLGSLREVRRPLAVSLAVLGVGLAVAVAVQVGSGLSGLNRLGQDLRRVRDGSADRLPRPGISELDPLVAEINAALDQNATLLARSRQHLGNLAHSLKTPLAALSNDLPPGDPGQALIARMDRLIGWHLRRARSAQPRVLGQRTPVAPVIDDILLVLRHPMQDKGMTATVTCPADLTFAGERQDLEELIGNLCDNAVKWGRTRLAITARPGLTLRIEDDGPGMNGTDAPRALIRGARLDESGPPGTGLGLAIVADLAALHGGELRLDRSQELGGLAAEIYLPE